MRRGPIDARLVARLGSNRLPHRVTVQRATEVKNQYGERTQTWAAVPGLSGIPAVVVPSSQVKQRGTEFVQAEETHQLMLGGYFPNLTSFMRLTVEDGGRFDILGVEHDPWHQWTQLRTREVL